MAYAICLAANSVTDKPNIELILSIVAIVISLLAIACEFFGNQRINRVNLEANFYEKIYNDFLLTTLPNARKKLVFNNNIISGTETLIDTLNDIRRDSIFFLYRDEKFYKELCAKLQELEDELVKKSDKVLENDDFCKFTENVNEELEVIYSIIISKYTGKLLSRKKKRRKK